MRTLWRKIVCRFRGHVEDGAWYLRSSGPEGVLMDRPCSRCGRPSYIFGVDLAH